MFVSTETLCAASTDEAQYAETADLNRKAQAEIDALYDEIDNQICGKSSSKSEALDVQKVQKTPRRLSQMCEQLLGVTPKTCKERLESEQNKCLNSLDITWFRDQKPDYSDATIDSPFYNYETIEFGKNGEVCNVCAVCKTAFADLDTLMRHHWKKHPSVQFNFLEIEKGNHIEELHFVKPSCEGTLAVSDPGWQSVMEMDCYKCSHCGGVFKSQAKLHIHIVNCSPIDPLYGSQKTEKSSMKTPLKRKIQRKIQTMLGNGGRARAKLEFESGSSSSTISSSLSHKRVFTGSRKRISVLLPDSPVKEDPDDVLPAPIKVPEPVVIGYNPNRHVRRRELTELVDLLTCEGCGLKCKTIILLERHVRHCTRKEKFKTVKPLACPIIDDCADRVKNVCFYCDKSFTYTKSLINHFQDFCPVKKLKLDEDGVTEEDKERENAIIERIQKNEEEKIAIKEREMENSSKRKITWQVGRKPKRKGNAWAGRRKSSQTDEASVAAPDETPAENEDVDEQPENVEKDSVEKSEGDQSSDVNKTTDSSGDNVEEKDKSDDLQEKVKEGAEEEVDEKEENEEMAEEKGEYNLNNMSLNCTARYEVNRVNMNGNRKAEKKSKAGVSGSQGAMSIVDMSSQESGASSSDEMLRRSYRRNVPDAGHIVEGKRKRERVGKVEEFLKNAFGRKRKKRDGDGKTETEESEDGKLTETAPVESVQETDSGGVKIETVVNETAAEAPKKRSRGRPKKVKDDNQAEIPEFLGEAQEKAGSSKEADNAREAVEVVRRRGRPKLKSETSMQKVGGKLKVINHDTDDEQVVPECSLETESVSDAEKESKSRLADNKVENENNNGADETNSLENMCNLARNESPCLQVKTLVDKNNVICTTEISVINTQEAGTMLDSGGESGRLSTVPEMKDEVPVTCVSPCHDTEGSVSQNDSVDALDGRSDITNSTERYSSSREVSPEKEFKPLCSDSSGLQSGPSAEQSVDDDVDSVDGFDAPISDNLITLNTDDNHDFASDENHAEAAQSVSNHIHLEDGENKSNRMRENIPESTNMDSTEGSMDTTDNDDSKRKDTDSSCARDRKDGQSSSAESDDGYGLVLSPSERVKMNRRSCKKDVDITSPVWVRRTQKNVTKPCGHGDELPNTETKDASGTKGASKTSGAKIEKCVTEVHENSKKDVPHSSGRGRKRKHGNELTVSGRQSKQTKK